MSALAAARRGRGFGAARRLDLGDDGLLANVEQLLGGGGREQVHGARDDPGPSGLMARPEAGTVVAVEVLVEEDEVAPVRILLEFARSAVDGPPAVRVAQKDRRGAAHNLLG